MKKVTVKNLIEFRKKNERTKITFINNLKKSKEKSKESSGGDYWISSVSAIRKSFKNNSLVFLDDKITDLNNKIRVTELKKTKDQFHQNIVILNNIKDYDFNQLKPDSNLTYLKQPKLKSLLDIKGFPIEANPCHIYTFSGTNNDEIGGIWFIAKKNGFERNELGMFADILYRYLVENYSKDFYVNPKYCVALDLFNGQEVNYSEIKDAKIPILLDLTLDDMIKYKL